MLALTRLSELRRSLAENHYDAFLVPLADVHQGEYIAPHDRRLMWLTGFSGSAGMAIVRRDDAAIFVDGRYTVQVARQVDLTVFTHEHLHDHPPAVWLGENMKAGDCIAYDPWLHTADQISAIETEIADCGATLVPVARNPIDAIWNDQPEPPVGKVIAYPEELAGETATDRRARVGAMVTEKGADRLVITQPDNIAWIMNVRGSDVAYNPMPHSFLILASDGSADWFIDPRKLEAEKNNINLTGVTLHAPDRFKTSLEATGRTGKTIWVDPVRSPVLCNLSIEASGGTVLREEDPVTYVKAHKNTAELKAMRTANKRDSIAWAKFLAWLDTNASERAAAGDPITEIEAAEKILSHRAESNLFMEPSFESISAADGNAALCHYEPKPGAQGTLNADTIYLLDSGGQYLDGTTDTTRTIAIGDAPDYIKDCYTRVLKGHIALACLRFPKGTKGHQIDVIARQHLWQVGLDYDHGTGHGVGVGLSVHEAPQRIAKMVNDVELAAGMTITNEPGYYEAEKFGIRIENLCEIVEGEDGFLELSDMTLAPIDTNLINRSLMTDSERDWLNAYHARVRSELLPQLDGDVADWMIQATQPI